MNPLEPFVFGAKAYTRHQKMGEVGDNGNNTNTNTGRCSLVLISQVYSSCASKNNPIEYLWMVSSEILPKVKVSCHLLIVGCRQMDGQF